MTENNTISEDQKKILLEPITERLKIQYEQINSLRKELNNNIRETISFKSTNENQNKKVQNKSINFESSFKMDLKITQKQIASGMRDDISDYTIFQKKLKSLYEDIDRITKYCGSCEDRIKNCEDDVGVQLK